VHCTVAHLQEVDMAGDDPGFPVPSQSVYDEHRHDWVPSLGQRGE
jgi:hypothetical protein